MTAAMYWTSNGDSVPSVTAVEMRELDRIAVEEFGLGIMQMMENAGRNLTENILDMLSEARPNVTILAGPGGNGGGGICCARHLHNRGIQVNLILSKDPAELRGAARNQLTILQNAGFQPINPMQARAAIEDASIVVDALIGYSLQGAPRGRSKELIELSNQFANRTLSLDIPSGMDATTGHTPGCSFRAQRTLTLALPKTGLKNFSGELYVADIGIPPEAFIPLDLMPAPFFKDRYWVRLFRNDDADAH